MSNFLEGLNLTVEQKFEIEKIRQEVQSLSRDQAIKLLLETARTLMVKDNLIRDLMRRSEL